MADPRENPNAKAELDKAMGRKATSGDPDSKPTGVAPKQDDSASEAGMDDRESHFTKAVEGLRALFGIKGKEPLPNGGASAAAQGGAENATAGNGAKAAVDQAVNSAPGGGEYGG